MFLYIWIVWLDFGDYWIVIWICFWGYRIGFELFFLFLLGWNGGDIVFLLFFSFICWGRKRSSIYFWDWLVFLFYFFIYNGLRLYFFLLVIVVCRGGIGKVDNLGIIFYSCFYSFLVFCFFYRRLVCCLYLI